jgi:hypothetical protein
MDRVKGHPLRSLPGCYPARNPQVRARFDALEQEFAAQLPEVTKQAAARRAQDPAGMAAVLDEFSAECVAQATEAVEELLATMPEI